MVATSGVALEVMHFKLWLSRYILDAPIRLLFGSATIIQSRPMAMLLSADADGCAAAVGGTSELGGLVELVELRLVKVMM